MIIICLYTFICFQVFLFNTNNFKQIYLTSRGDSNRYYHSRSVELWVMAIKGYSTLGRSPELDPPHQMQFCINTQDTPVGGRVLSPAGWATYKQDLCWYAYLCTRLKLCVCVWGWKRVWEREREREREKARDWEGVKGSTEYAPLNILKCRPLTE